MTSINVAGCTLAAEIGRACGVTDSFNMPVEGGMFSKGFFPITQVLAAMTRLGQACGAAGGVAGGGGGGGGSSHVVPRVFLWESAQNAQQEAADIALIVHAALRTLPIAAQVRDRHLL
jgi:hypothetical protein